MIPFFESISIIIITLTPPSFVFIPFSLILLLPQSVMSNAQIDRILTEQSPSKLHTYLKKQSLDSLATVFSGYDPLDQLNPAVHSLGYLYILYVSL